MEKKVGRGWGLEHSQNGGHNEKKGQQWKRRRCGSVYHTALDMLLLLLLLLLLFAPAGPAVAAEAEGSLADAI